MIPRADITAWRSIAPWRLNEQVEQDLVICKTIVEIFSDPILKDMLAFRGGTALYKIYLEPQARYSEDIDLVQTNEGPIGPIFDHLRKRLSFLGEPRVKQSQGNNTLIYRFESEIEPVVRMRLKVEINCREHFTVLGLKQIPFDVHSRWFSGNCFIVSYDLNELLGTKLRALYQRKKGRDLFDLWYAAKSEEYDAKEVIRTFKKYMEFGKFNINRNQFIDNLQEKIIDADFIGDTVGLLRTGIEYKAEDAHVWILQNLLGHLD